MTAVRWTLCGLILFSIAFIQNSMIDRLVDKMDSPIQAIPSEILIIIKIFIFITAILYWFLITTGFHSVSVLMNCKSRKNYTLLMQYIGMGLIVLLVAVIINHHYMDDIIRQSVNQTGSFEYKNLIQTGAFKMARFRIFLAYLLHIAWSVFSIKKIYKLGHTETAVFSSIVLFIVISVFVFRKMIH